MRISFRLYLCFALLIGMAVVAELLSAWQLNRTGRQAEQLNRMDQQAIAILHANNVVVGFAGAAASAAQAADLADLERSLAPIKPQLKQDVAEAMQAVDSAGSQQQNRDFLRGLLSFFEVSVPDEVDVLLDLARAGDW